ncbi:hypothetical protein [Massilia sp. MS-15]|uniref:hypothetical protein n=1 Tax=Massilia sp. MS-15 TaxID=2878200 RepID=UPI001CD2320A|nr:hypothetical protein [Massilia sp. MS-15]MCA1245345.1 hypothetical protein [Massilia sp. MS-15]
MNTIRATSARHGVKRRTLPPPRKPRCAFYPLLGICLVVLTAVLAYGAVYLLLR